MESLAYLHLVLAAQEKSQTNNLGASWDKAAWNEIFEESKPAPKKPRIRHSRNAVKESTS